MPEGPEVRRVADWLRQQTVGKYLLDIKWSVNSRYNTEKRHPSLTPDCYLDIMKYFPFLISDVRSHGKIIIFTLQGNGFEVYLTNHLNMEGRWTQIPDKHSDLWLILAEELETSSENRCFLENIPYFDDSRKFGYLAIHPSLKELEDALNKKVGPDLLEAALSGKSLLGEWREVVAKKKKIVLSEFLHNPRNFAGIGNYLRAEIMYEARVDPHRKLGDLSPEEIDLLYDRTMAIIKASYESHGLTISSYQDPSGFKGTYNVKVYSRSTDDYGNPVEKYRRTNTSQTIHWCPAVQK